MSVSVTVRKETGTGRKRERKQKETEGETFWRRKIRTIDSEKSTTKQFKERPKRRISGERKIDLRERDRKYAHVQRMGEIPRPKS